MGPMGMLQGSLVQIGASLMRFFKWIEEAFGVSSIIAGMILCSMGVTVGLFCILVFAFLTAPKIKRD